jgi:hypothetical protein
MWSGGLPAGTCGEDAWSEFIPGEEWIDAYTGEVKRYDRKYNGYVPGLACPKHGGAKPEEPYAFIDGTDEQGRAMWCAVYPDFINLQESPACFDTKPWVAIKKLQELVKT